MNSDCNCCSAITAESLWPVTKEKNTKKALMIFIKHIYRIKNGKKHLKCRKLYDILKKDWMSAENQAMMAHVDVSLTENWG